MYIDVDVVLWSKPNTHTHTHTHTHICPGNVNERDGAWLVMIYWYLTLGGYPKYSELAIQSLCYDRVIINLCLESKGLLSMRAYRTRIY